jgi:molybdopterin/thiamine biosynthesis adenylyltransferase
MESADTLSSAEYSRYSRQLIMPSIGLEGQKKLKAAKVLLIGAGGLGSPASLYLAGAGVGTLGLVDADVVDESNLHRQVIHTEERVGQKKIESAQAQIQAFNRFTKVVGFDARLTASNAEEIIGSEQHCWDLVMDGSDNAATRYLINDACVLFKKPLVSGSALQWEGQITVLNYLDGPCYRCLYPKPPPAHAVTNCSDGGVVGMVPGVIGQLQAIEIVKLILGVPKEQTLWRRMIFFDGLAMKFRNVTLREKNPVCQACGESPSKISSVKAVDYADFCQTNCSKYALIRLPPSNSISP